MAAVMQLVTATSLPASALGLLMLIHARALGAGVAITAAGVMLAPTPAAAFVCDNVNSGEVGAGASPWEI